MITHWHLAISVGCLALYLGVLARWHGARYPRVVSGPADFALLIFGLGGLALFGPFGKMLASGLFGKPDPLDWLSLASGMTLTILLLSKRAWRRLIIYHIDPATLDSVLEEEFAQETGLGRPVRTIHGFEDRARGRGVRVDASRRWMVATVEAYGEEPERCIQSLERRLARRLEAVPVPPSQTRRIFSTGAGLAAMLALAALVLGQPHARAVFRALLQRLPGGS